jgi:hypothetical protein
MQQDRQTRVTGRLGKSKLQGSRTTCQVESKNPKSRIAATPPNSNNPPATWQVETAGYPIDLPSRAENPKSRIAATPPNSNNPPATWQVETAGYPFDLPSRVENPKSRIAATAPNSNNPPATWQVETAGYPIDLPSRVEKTEKPQPPVRLAKSTLQIPFSAPYIVTIPICPLKPPPGSIVYNA